MPTSQTTWGWILHQQTQYLTKGNTNFRIHMAVWHICMYQTGKFISELNRCVRLNITAYINWEDSKSGVLSRDCLEMQIIKNKDVLLEIKHPHATELGIVKWACPDITGRMSLSTGMWPHPSPSTERLTSHPDNCSWHLCRLLLSILFHKELISSIIMF